ncbi:MFS transporter [Pseudodesulfovibrio sp.]|uniref:MFS transporter n=1 Tax=unclassified Pseudodesulfovibrio TaxID=2661612 RepID=UPI003B001FCA
MPSTNQANKPEKGFNSALMLPLFTLSIAALVSNLYYAQPLVASIAPDIGVSAGLAGSVASITQIGYGLGLFFLLSLADQVENRLLVLLCLTGTIAGLFGVALAHSAEVFFLSSFIIGLCSTVGQVLMLTIAHITPLERRGRVVGCVMAGLLGGIMLARSFSLFVAGYFGWRGIFYASGTLLFCLGVALAFVMPRNKPQGGMHYGRILTSMLRLLIQLPAVRRRAIYQGLLFCIFNIFWTSIPLLLADRFGMGSYQIGLFALAGAGSVVAAPWAGRQADKGRTTTTSLWAISIVAAVLAFSGIAAALATVSGLLACTILLDAGVQTNQILSQRIVFSVPTAIGGRANGIYMTIMFAGGALGSVLGTLLYHWQGWTAVAGGGTTLGLLALMLFQLEPKSGKEDAVS